MKPKHEYQNTNTKIKQFIPQNEMQQQIALMMEFLFLLFSVRSNKQDKLVKNN